MVERRVLTLVSLHWSTEPKISTTYIPALCEGGRAVSGRWTKISQSWISCEVMTSMCGEVIVQLYAYGLLKKYFL